MVIQSAKMVAYILICTKEGHYHLLTFLFHIVTKRLWSCYIVFCSVEGGSQGASRELACCVVAHLGYLVLKNINIAVLMSGGKRERKGGRKKGKVKKKKVD